MEPFLNFFLPVIVITALCVMYVLLLRYIRRRNDQTNTTPQNVARNLPKSAPVVPYMEPILINFSQALKQALPEKYIIYSNVPLEKLFEVSRRESLQMVGQYADFVVFTPNWLPVLIIDLFDMSIINLDRVNRIKTASKEILRNSGIPVLDYQYTDNCNIDELRRKIANLLNPLRADNRTGEK